MATQTFQASAPYTGTNLTVVRTYTLEETQPILYIDVAVTASGGDVPNVRVWVGTQDDYIGTTDNPHKLVGDFSNNSFVALSSTGTTSNNGTDTGRVLEIESGAEGLLFAPATGRDVYVKAVITTTFGEFVKLVETDPTSSTVDLTNNGSCVHHSNTGTRSSYGAVNNRSPFSTRLPAQSLCSVCTLSD